MNKRAAVHKHLLCMYGGLFLYLYCVVIKASGGWLRCAAEDVSHKCAAHLTPGNAEAVLNGRYV